MHKASISKASLGLITLMGALCVSHSSWAQSPSHAQLTQEKINKKAVKKTKPPKPDKGNGETVQERERRLLRECKGRTNAGACEGYAS